MKFRILLFLPIALSLLSSLKGVHRVNLTPKVSAESASGTNIGLHPTPASAKERQIFAMAIDDWGRGSNCTGWGLCNFRACFFCCVDQNYNKIDCTNKTEMAREGWIYLTGQSGYITIELNSDNPEEGSAINEQWTLYVDSDIYTNDLKIHSGEYDFDPVVGGYKVPVSLEE